MTTTQDKQEHLAYIKTTLSDLQWKLEVGKHDPREHFESEFDELFLDYFADAYQDAIEALPFTLTKQAWLDLCEEQDAPMVSEVRSDFADNLDVSSLEEYKEAEHEIEELEHEILALEEELEEEDE